MDEVVVVTESSADLPPPLADELVILVAPGRIDFRDGHFLPSWDRQRRAVICPVCWAVSYVAAAR